MNTLVRISTDVETCDVCCRPARKVARIRMDDGAEINAAHRCARYLLGYNPFGGKR
jgi:ribosome-binding protein aMBF1 (putative translation factor)